MIFVFIFFFITTTHSFYDLYGDIPFEYEVVFTGKVIISSKYFNYTNTNSSFNFNYAVVTRSEFSTDKQVIVDWYFSNLTTSQLPLILSSIWSYYLQSKQKEIAYSVKLDTDQFLVFDKKGQRHPIGYFLESIFPIVNLQRSIYQQQYYLELPESPKQKSFMTLKIQGWDFFRQTRPTNSSPLILLETNTPFINNIYQHYEQKQKDDIPTVFWIQNIEITHLNAYKQLKGESILTGIYFLDLQNKIISQAAVIGKITTEIPYQYHNFQLPFKVFLEGQFDIALKAPPQSQTLDQSTNFIKFAE
ncbi:MAG: hypothetical protein ACRCWI_08020 [Brevinema sp.]